MIHSSQPLTQVHVGETLVETLIYEAGKNPYIIPDINLQTSQIVINRKDQDTGAVQLVEVEVYGEFTHPSEYFIYRY